jgi:hypothetical protein
VSLTSPVKTAGRTLEDLDRYFAEQPSLLVFRDKEAISSKRPEHYIEREAREVRRHSSVRSVDVSAAARRHLGDVLDRVGTEDGDAGIDDKYYNGTERYEKEEEV